MYWHKLMGQEVYCGRYFKCNCWYVSEGEGWWRYHGWLIEKVECKEKIRNNWSTCTFFNKKENSFEETEGMVRSDNAECNTFLLYCCCVLLFKLFWMRLTDLPTLMVSPWLSQFLASFCNENARSHLEDHCDSRWPVSLFKTKSMLSIAGFSCYWITNVLLSEKLLL